MLAQCRRKPSSRIMAMLVPAIAPSTASERRRPSGNLPPSAPERLENRRQAIPVGLPPFS